MKKVPLILGIGLIVLSSCSNDDILNPVVTPEAPQGKAVPMTFATYKANQSRDGGTTSDKGLETQYLDFGVWAFKTNDTDGGDNIALTDGKSKQLVMANYMVGFTGNDYGYNPSTENAGKWFYEGLGNKETFTFNGKTGIQTTKSTSVNDYQYLKYWDDSFKNTYFIAYTPYDSRVSFDSENLELELPNASFKYAYQTIENATYNHANVPLEFNSLGSSIRLAFTTDIKGYKVELSDYSATNKGNAYFVPTTVTTTTNGETTTTTYSQGTYTAKESTTTTVVFSIDNTTKKLKDPTVTESSTSTTSAAMTFENPTDAVPTNSTYVYTKTKDVKVQENTCGFTLNIGLKLTAIDTGEVIYVKGVRAFVPAADVNWAENTAYTYKFKITKNVKGTTGTPTSGDLGYGPSDSQALYPIIFEDVTITDMSSVEKGEYPVHSVN